MAVLSNTGILAGASAAGGDGYKVEKGLIFDSSQSSYLSWEPTDMSTAADPTTGVRNFTISFWTKVDGTMAGTKAWCSAGSSSQINGILQFYIEDGKITINCYNAYMQSTRKLADPAAWYHIVLAVDTDQAVDTDRFKVWVNNERITDWGGGTSTTYPYRGHPILWNTNVPHQIGTMRNASSANSNFGNGHLAEFYNIDGQTLDPSYFGETDSNGKWVPIEYTGTYGLQVDNSEDWSGNNDPTDAPLSSSGGSWDSAASTAEQLFTHNPGIAGNVYAGGVGQTLTWEPASQYTFTDKVEIRTTSFNGAAYAQVATITYSDLTTASTTFTDWGWTTIATGGGTIKKIEMQAAAGDYNYWNALRIDGKVLIDSAHSTVTDNGFYLKFSGNAKVYSDDIEGTEYDQTWYTKDMMFDGDTATSYLAWNGNDVIWTPSGGLAFDSTLRIETGDGDIVFNWDGGSYTLTTSGGKTWYDVSSNVQSPITSVTWTCSALGSGPYVYRVEVDGEVLINHNDIETDSSGNDNHVKAHNLAAISGQIYSSGSTVGTVSNPWTYAFDGLEGDGAYTYSNSSATITLPSPKDWNSKFEVYILYYGGTLTVNGSDVGSSNISSGGTTPTWYDITSIVGSSGTLTSIGVSDTPTGYYTSLRAIRLDGEVLIDGPGDADLVLDSPSDFSNDGQGVGNYCTLNPLQNAKGWVVDTFSQGNLKADTNATYYGVHTSTLATPLSGKWYAEVKVSGYVTYTLVGLVDAASNFTPTSTWDVLDGVAYYASNGNKYVDTVASSYGAAYDGTSVNYVIGIAYDADNQTVNFYKDGVDQGTITGVPLRHYFFGASDWDGSNGVAYTWNFGQRDFKHPQSGYKALNTYNLPDPTIKDPSKHFDVSTWTADDGDSKDIDGLNFQPDMVWGKNRTTGVNHQIFDAVRGAGSGKELTPNYVTALGGSPGEGNTTDPYTEAYGFLSAFNSDGFTVAKGIDATGYKNYYWNYQTNEHVAWCWNAGGTSVENDASETSIGSIDSTYRANPSAGFSIVSYTGTGSNGTVAHGLNATPNLILIKSRAGTNSWPVYHSDIGIGSYGRLESTSVWDTASASLIYNTTPTSTVFGVGTGTWVNGSGTEYIAYCWSEVAGYSKIGQYDGTALASPAGTFAYCGFRPAWILVKNADATEDWFIWDNERDGYNPTYQYFKANDVAAENANTNDGIIDITSTGFKIRSQYSPNNANTYVFAAFAESPFKYANAR